MRMMPRIVVVFMFIALCEAAQPVPFAQVAARPDRTLRGYSRPVRARMTRTRRIKPSPPLGKYPQLALCGQVGNAPTSNNTNTMMTMVLIWFLLHAPDAW